MTTEGSPKWRQPGHVRLEPDDEVAKLFKARRPRAVVHFVVQDREGDVVVQVKLFCLARFRVGLRQYKVTRHVLNTSE